MSGSRAQCGMGLVVLVALGIVPFAPQLGAAIEDGRMIVTSAQASTHSVPVAQRQQSAPYVIATDMALDAPGCIVEIEGRPVRPVEQSDGSYWISPAMVLAEACFPRGSS